MNSVLRDLKMGWADARWSFYFTLALLPSITVAVLLAYLLEGRATTPPSPMTWLLCLPATLLSLFWAGLKDGLDGRLGRHVWLLTLLLVGYLLLLHLLRARQSVGRTRVRLAGHAFNVVATVLSDGAEGPGQAHLPRGDISWEPLVIGAP
jgi:hypothetical protein